MSDPQKTQWISDRLELYEELHATGRKGLSADAIRKARQSFAVVDGAFVPQPYRFPTENDAVGLVCAAIPPVFAHVCRVIGEELVAVLPPDANGDPSGYVNDEKTMHMTLFHTSHPDDLVTNARLRVEESIAIVRQLASSLAPFDLRPHRVVMCSSGAIILLYEAAVDDVADDPCSVDRLRLMAKEAFSPHFPTRQSKSIMHSTLARVLNPEVSADVVERLHRLCEELTVRLRRDHDQVRIENLWFVDETHHFWAHGETTVLPLGSGL
ncbi:hypothetical protein ATCC90586_006803 [Pythium insidiosum]|nr:hypothetical protein ATCC90586_006803 [Pythium insidiosum]